MKKVPLRTAGDFVTREIINTAVANAPQGINITQMRARIRILDAIDKADTSAEELQLEDNDYAALVDIINGMAWARADRNLLLIIDDILGAAIAA